MQFIRRHFSLLLLLSIVQLSVNTQTIEQTSNESQIPQDSQTPTPTETIAPTDQSAPAIPQKDQEIFDFTNQIRQDPKILIPYLQQLYASFVGNTMHPDGLKYGIVTKEGPSAVLEAIEFLNNTKPVGPLTWDQSLANSCINLVEDIGPKGLFQTTNSNGETFEERIHNFANSGNEEENIYREYAENLFFGNLSVKNIIAHMIIGDGSPGRQLRNQIFSSDFTKMGVFSGPHSKYREMICMDFSN
eukprot:403364762